ncbi:uncharacterized protein B0H18DRAFT_1126517 [Fomitopsis serialis]|uniref:uncharacterized protein n=1 Tax=Fomitopsis serialis TaxID=139415 RepID=UPI0020078176|nr:uncharacterized protein B0H18DRAFT_1126517 [Neoantrodia serialis]KAH9913158.1 hypothetical protein B0H18DRAFT_1126517 [Neoantrodia serialis]
MPIIISSDKTQLTTFRSKSAYPVYLTIGNLPKEIRRKPSHRGQILLAYLPAGRLQHITNKAARRRTLANVFHACLSMILEPLRQPGVDGIEMTSGDGVVRRCHPILAVYVGDYPEQVLVTGTYTGDCPICKCPHDELGDYPCLSSPRDVDEVFAALHLAGTADYNRACNITGIKPIQHPFWEHLPYVDIFRSITPDILHQLHQGVIKHVLAWITDIVGKDEVDARVKRLPPNHSIRVFHKGVSGLSRVTGTEHKQIARFILGLLIDVPLPRDESADLISATTALLDFLYMSQYSVHSSATLAALESSLSVFHAKKDVFIRLGARSNFLIPKLHMLTHYVRAIKLYGTTDNYNTEATERLHIDFAKEAYRATNHKDEFPQMTRWLERREKVLQHANYVEWRLLRVDGSHEDAVAARRVVRWRPPDMACTLQHVMTKYPSRKAVPIAELVSPDGYGASFLIPALARFVVEHTNPSLSRNEVEARAAHMLFPFSTLPVFHKAKFRNVEHHGKETLDSIHARPRQLGHDSEILIPARFDTALVRVRRVDDQLEADRRIGLSDTRAGRVRVIFSLPEKILRQWFPPGTAPQCPRHLVYVEWFSKFAAAPDSHHHMYKIKALTGPEGIASVVPLAMLERSVHLHPKWGSPVPVHWTSENVLDNLPQYYSFAHYSETTVCELVNAIKYGLITELPGIITNNPKAGLAHHDLHVLDEWDSVLNTIATWCHRYYPSGKAGKRLAMHVLRTTGDVWFGIGVYTVCEIFFLAGISPYLREGEVFGNPSRLARLVLAYYAFVHKAVTKTWVKRVKPCIRDGVVAATVEERLRIGNGMFVWAKDKAGVSQRLFDSVRAHNYEGATSSSDDPFEPTFIRAALERSPHLGRIVFGDLWGSIAPSDLANPRTPPDALSKFLTELKSRYDTRLDSKSMSPLFLPDSELCRRRTPTYRYQVAKNGVWSIVPAPRYPQFKRTDKETKLFRYIVQNTAMVAVGPLEYCANAQVVRKPSKIRTHKPGARFYVLPARGALPDNVPLSLGHRNLTTLERKKSMTPEARVKRNNAARAAAQAAAAKAKRKSKKSRGAVEPKLKVLTGNIPLTAQQRKARTAQLEAFNNQPHVIARNLAAASDVTRASAPPETVRVDATAPVEPPMKRRKRAEQEVLDNQAVVQELPRTRRTRGLVLNMTKHPDDAALGIRHRRHHSTRQ